MELFILKTVEWKIYVATPMQFLQHVSLTINIGSSIIAYPSYTTSKKQRVQSMEMSSILWIGGMVWILLENIDLPDSFP